MNGSIGILGAGAIGLCLAYHLSGSNDDVTILARPSAVDELSRTGIELKERGGEGTKRFVKVSSVRTAREFDLLILAVKGHQLMASGRELEDLLKNSRIVVTAMNGVPWWFPLGIQKAPPQLVSVDKDNFLSIEVDPSKIVGAVVNIAAKVEGVGIVHHVHGRTLQIGPALPLQIELAREVQEYFAGSGIVVECEADIRETLWLKLVNNAALNPVSAVTGWTIDKILKNAGSRAICRLIMEEVAAVGRALSVVDDVDVTARLAFSESFGAFKTSMLQDLEAGRVLETGSLCDAVVELARHSRVPVPTLEGILKVLNSRSPGLSELPIDGEGAIACLLEDRGPPVQ